MTLRLRLIQLDRLFVIIAIKTRKYGGMAKNLAVSLKCVFPEIPITVISDGSYERIQDHKKYADRIIQTNESNPFKLKTELNKIMQEIESPWYCYIDADSIISNPAIFEQDLKSITTTDFYIQVYGYSQADSGYVPDAWGDISKIAKHYEFDQKYPRYNTSLIYWRNTKETAKYWQHVSQFYDDPAELLELIAGYYPDEVAFSAASAKLGLYPSLYEVEATYFRWSKSHWKNYGIISLAGANQNRQILKIYNSIALNNAKKEKTEFFEMRERYKLSYGSY